MCRPATTIEVPTASSSIAPQCDSHSVVQSRTRSTEREREHLDFRLQEFDLELPVLDRRRLTDQLVHPWLDDDAAAVGVDVAAVRSPRRAAIDENAKRHALALRLRAHHKMQVAGVKTVDDA